MDLQKKQTDKSALRVIFEKNKDVNHNVMDILSQRQGVLIGKEKKQTRTSSSNQKSLSFHLNQQKQMLNDQHELQIKNLEKSFDSKIQSLQTSWSEERNQMQSQIDKLIIKLHEQEQENERLKEEVEYYQSESDNNALLYRESVRELEETRSVQERKSSILSRLRAEMDTSTH